MNIDKLKAELAKLEIELADVRSRAALAKRSVDAAADARVKAGNPRAIDHPTVLAHNAALVDYDRANNQANETYARYAKVRGQWMMYESQTMGSISAPVHQARIAPAAVPVVEPSDE